MGNHVEVVVERFGEGYMIRANSDSKMRYDTLFPEDILELKSVIKDYGVMPEMIDLNNAEEDAIRDALDRKLR